MLNDPHLLPGANDNTARKRVLSSVVDILLFDYSSLVVMLRYWYGNGMQGGVKSYRNGSGVRNLARMVAGRLGSCPRSSDVVKRELC